MSVATGIRLLFGGCAVVLFLLPVGWGLLQQQGTDSWRPLSLRGQVVREMEAGERDGVLLLYAHTLVGLQRSVDGGHSWQRLDGGWDRDGFGRAAIMAWTVAPADARFIYVVARFQNEAALFVSADGGNSWVLHPWRSTLAESGAIASAGEDSELLLIAVGQEFWRSRNGGAQWTSVAWPGPAIRDLAVDRGNPNIVYATTEEGGWWSADGGSTWETARGLAPDAPVHGLRVAPSEPGVAYVLQQGRLWQTQDGGRTWQMSSAAVEVEPIQAITVDPAVHARVYTATETGIRWHSGGDRAALLGSAPGVLEVLSLAVAVPDRDQLYAGTSDGLWIQSISAPQPTPTPTPMPTFTPVPVQPEPDPPLPTATPLVMPGGATVLPDEQTGTPEQPVNDLSGGSAETEGADQAVVQQPTPTPTYSYPTATPAPPEPEDAPADESLHEQRPGSANAEPATGFGTTNSNTGAHSDTHSVADGHIRSGTGGDTDIAAATAATVAFESTL